MDSPLPARLGTAGRVQKGKDLLAPKELVGLVFSHGPNSYLGSMHIHSTLE